MRKYSAILLFAGALLTGACAQRESELPTAGTTRTVAFHAVPAATKTTFGALEEGLYPTLWTDADRAVKVSVNEGAPIETPVEPAADARSATFRADVDAASLSAPYTFQAVSPASAARTLSPSRHAWNITIPAVQTPLPGSVDEAAQILTAAVTTTAIPSELDLHFSHLTAYLRLSVRGLDLGEAAVSTVEITASTPIVGDWYWNCTDGSLSDNGASSTLTLQASTLDELWFAVAPVDLSGQTLSLSVNTDAGCYSKRITFPDGRVLTGGKVARFSVDFTGIEAQSGSDGNFVLVTDASSLQEGDEILVLNPAGTRALGPAVTTGRNPYRQAVSVSVQGDAVADAGDAVVLTLHPGSSDGTWVLYDGSGYLCTASGNNALSTRSSVNAAASWSISIAADGNATVQARSGSSNLLKYNASNPRFSAYSSSSRNVSLPRLYRKVSAAGPVAEDPVTLQTVPGAYLGSNAYVYHAGEDQLVRSYSGDALTFAIVPGDRSAQTEIIGWTTSLVKGDAVTVTVIRREGNKKVLDERYPMRVVKEAGPWVWLGNGTGNGFVIKK